MLVRLLVAASGVVVSAVAQAPQFEVATVRPSSPQTVARPGYRMWRSGGPGTDDPGILTITLFPLRLLVRDAFGVPPDHIVGPAWIDDEKYDIVAKVPLGSTRADASLMLRSLLIERLHMSVRLEPREMPGYVLTVAKGGPKLRESVVDPAVKPLQGLANCRLGPDHDGFPQMAPGCRGDLRLAMSGTIKITAQQVALDSLAKALSPVLNVSSERIVDETGLTGIYDYRLGFSGTGLSTKASADQDPSGLPDLFGALEKQLGLKLQQKKLLINMVIVDHVDRVPAEN